MYHKFVRKEEQTMQKLESTINAVFSNLENVQNTKTINIKLSLQHLQTVQGRSPWLSRGRHHQPVCGNHWICPNDLEQLRKEYSM